MELTKINKYLELEKDSIVNVFITPHYHYDYLWCSVVLSIR